MSSLEFVEAPISTVLEGDKKQYRLTRHRPTTESVSRLLLQRKPALLFFRSQLFTITKEIPPLLVGADSNHSVQKNRIDGVGSLMERQTTRRLTSSPVKAEARGITQILLTLPKSVK